MQTRDEVEGLHNCREFSQPLECGQCGQLLRKCIARANEIFSSKTTYKIIQVNTGHASEKNSYAFLSFHFFHLLADIQTNN